MGCASYLLVAYRDTICRKNIMLPWVQCAYTRQCMTLVGVNKTHHLPEQGVLSLIMMNNNKSAFTTIHFRPYNSHDPPELDNKYIRGALESIRTRSNIHATVQTLSSWGRFLLILPHIPAILSVHTNRQTENKNRLHLYPPIIQTLSNPLPYFF